VTPKAFAAQISYLRLAGYTTITLDDLARALSGGATLPAKPIILTFDDGYQDFYDNVFPLLKKYRDLATIYIITGKVGHAGYMTWDELRELAASPLITIGAHTRTHPDLRALTPEHSWDELAGSKHDLELELGIPVRHLAYPSGDYNASVLAQVEQIGFTTAVTTREGFSERANQLLTLERVRVNGYTALADLIAGLRGQRGARPRPPRSIGRIRACAAQLVHQLGYCAARAPSRRWQAILAP
jgi:peptidoglycan/xylan/chitin deacetylase (PgdA/CDA1 family)